ncbi:hypothetical protein BCR34DRAFT_143804 [Clohesyomyces aquaticus]|uniref:Uncharacterized protein n=1 Tax=Clohesyomyces aquaticus TaxID=1231657 RepID=A0A1Y2A0F7_9PLEO|nr:hypothetical protein BCR34DRAFT_143804 [Clohesyomyces aquaticus]
MGDDCYWMGVWRGGKTERGVLCVGGRWGWMVPSRNGAECGRRRGEAEPEVHASTALLLPTLRLCIRHDNTNGLVWEAQQRPFRIFSCGRGHLWFGSSCPRVSTSHRVPEPGSSLIHRLLASPNLGRLYSAQFCNPVFLLSSPHCLFLLQAGVLSFPRASWQRDLDAAASLAQALYDEAPG